MLMTRMLALMKVYFPFCMSNDANECGKNVSDQLIACGTCATFFYHVLTSSVIYIYCTEQTHGNMESN